MGIVNFHHQTQKRRYHRIIFRHQLHALRRLREFQERTAKTVQCAARQVVELGGAGQYTEHTCVHQEVASIDLSVIWSSRQAALRMCEERQLLEGDKKKFQVLATKPQGCVS